ncbi:MAG TPA: sensor domain-containing diguanylate cyclase [Stellaceae bacterium]|nr:sensor domain-containing diguanylate cyclase [Stellaceae bacterium]
MLEIVPGAVVHGDSSGIIRGCNTAFRSLVGRPMEQIIGRPVSDLLPGAVPLLEAGSAANGETGGPPPGLSGLSAIDRFETVFERANGTICHLSVAARLLRDADGSVIGFVQSLFDVTERKTLEAEIGYLISTDALTGALNRRAYMTAAEVEIARGLRYRTPTAFLMIEIDQFDRVDEAYGQAAGDEAVKRVSEVIRTTLREHDLVGRLGRHRFSAVLPETDQPEAERAGERVCQAIEGTTIIADTGCFHVTVSIGLATSLADADSAEIALMRADEGLGSARQGGRNRVVAA